MFSSFSNFFRKTPVRNEEASASADSLMPQIGASIEAAKATCVQYDNFSKEWMAVSQQDNFDGFRVEAGKPISKFLQSSHTLILGTSAKNPPYAYQFGPVFQTEDGRFFLMGKYSIDGMLNARLVKKVCGPYVDLRANITSCLVDKQRNACEFSVDVNNDKWALSSKLVWQGVLITNLGFSRMMTPHLHLGGELTYLNLYKGASMGTLGLRHSQNDHTFSMTVGRTPDFKNPGRQTPLHGVRMQYMRKVSDRVSLGCEFDYSYPDNDSAMKLGYEYTFRTSRVQGLIDTAGKISCFVNDFKGFALSGLIDYVNDDYKFGVLMHYFPGQQGEGEGEMPML